MRRSSNAMQPLLPRAIRGRCSWPCISRCLASCAIGRPRLQRAGQIEPPAAFGIGLGSHDVDPFDERLGRIGARLHQRVDRVVPGRVELRRARDLERSAVVDEGGSLSEFLDSEVARYAPQLERYAAAVAASDSRPVQLALYFPLLGELRAWPAGATATRSD